MTEGVAARVREHEWSRAGREREAYIEAVDNAHRRYLGVSFWARHLGQVAGHSPCHEAAIVAATQSNMKWIAAREALEDFDDESVAAYRAAHAGMVASLIRFHREADYER